MSELLFLRAVPDGGRYHPATDNVQATHTPAPQAEPDPRDLYAVGELIANATSDEGARQELHAYAQNEYTRLMGLRNDDAGAQKAAYAAVKLAIAQIVAESAQREFLQA